MDPFSRPNRGALPRKPGTKEATADSRGKSPSRKNNSAFPKKATQKKGK